MAILNGLLGSFSGMVGNYVACRWKDGMYIRSRPRRSPYYQPSVAQLAQQQRFALATAFTKTLARLFRVSIQPDASGKPGRNRVLSRIVKQAITGTYPHLQIAFDKIYISEGSLPGAEEVWAVADGAGGVRFQWRDNSGVAGACRNDRVLVVVHCPELGQSTYSTTVAVRHAGVATLSVAGFAGKTVHTWLGFIAEDNRLAANSVYAGTLVVL